MKCNNQYIFISEPAITTKKEKAMLKNTKKADFIEGVLKAKNIGLNTKQTKNAPLDPDEGIYKQKT